MAGRHIDSRSTARERSHAELLKETLAHPGTREVMGVYQNWRKVDRRLDSYRAATREPHGITTTDHANPR